MTAVIRRLATIVASELDKQRTLPAAVLTVVGTVIVAAVTAAALAATPADLGTSTSAVDAAVRAVPFVQVGLILTGVLPVAHEYTGVQFRTTAAAVPNRLMLIGGKTVATLITAMVNAALSMGAALVAARAVIGSSADRASDVAATVAGSVTCLVLIALLGHAVTLLVRGLVPALVGMLVLVSMLSPMLAEVTEHARWLPDRAGRALYLPNADPLLGPGGGALVLFVWIATTGLAATLTTVHRDA